jgi:hypothetical protein
MLLLDDGVNLFTSVEEAEQHLEVVDVRSHPEWFGYDSSGQGLRLEIGPYERYVFFGIKKKDERVYVRLDPQRSLDQDATSREYMLEYILLNGAKADQQQLSQLPLRDLLGLILKRSSKPSAG